MNVTSIATTAVGHGYSVATSSSESLPNDGENPISQRDFYFRNVIMVKINFR